MNPRFRIRAIDVMVIAAIVAYGAYRSADRTGSHQAAPPAFARAVDLDPLFKTAVQADGRLRSFESHAKTYMGSVSGPRTVNQQSNGFTYLDIMFRPEAYEDVDLVYVKHKNVRAKILDAFAEHADLDKARRERIRKSGLFPRSAFSAPAVDALLQQLGQDLIRTAKAVDAINLALTISDSRVLSSNLRLLPPPGGGQLNAWLTLDDIAAVKGAPEDDNHASLTGRRVPGLDSALQGQLAETWRALRAEWRMESAEGVNEQIDKLASLLPGVAPEVYPSAERLATESWYFRHKSMTWVWLLYLAGVIPLLMSVIYKWDRARIVGLVLFVIAFIAQTTSVGIRWYISGRWPNANMFEAVTTSAWMGGVAALVLEYLVRRTAFRNLFALGSAVVSMAALMAAYFLPAQLDSTISNKMAALNDVWLYIHTNMIIWSYAVIGLACIPALLLLRQRWCTMWDAGAIPKARLLLLPIAVVALNYTSYVLLMHVIAPEKFELSPRAMVTTSGAFWGALVVVLLEVFAARERRLAGAKIERCASGGASSLIGGSAGSAFLKDDRPTATQVFDGATMVLVELSFIMLWTGIVMGAVWADHSWGRPWGWDPKEVFALNTFLIFLVLIHVRLKVKDRAFWTAVLAVAGFEVMMFNWIVVNFVITGLHSYA